MTLRDALRRKADSFPCALVWNVVCLWKGLMRYDGDQVDILTSGSPCPHVALCKQARSQLGDARARSVDVDVLCLLAADVDQDARRETRDTAP